jgi:hypothetical protein
MAQTIQLGRAKVQTLGSTERIDLAGVEGGQNFLNVQGGDAMNELLFS